MTTPDKIRCSIASWMLVAAGILLLAACAHTGIPGPERQGSPKCECVCKCPVCPGEVTSVAGQTPEGRGDGAKWREGTSVQARKKTPTPSERRGTCPGRIEIPFTSSQEASDEIAWGANNGVTTRYDDVTGWMDVDFSDLSGDWHGFGFPLDSSWRTYDLRDYRDCVLVVQVDPGEGLDQTRLKMKGVDKRGSASANQSPDVPVVSLTSNGRLEIPLRMFDGGELPFEQVRQIVWDVYKPAASRVQFRVKFPLVIEQESP